VKEMVDYKEVIGWVLGASIGVVWVAFGLLYSMLGVFEGRVFLVVALSITILFGTLSGGFIELSKNKNNYKEVTGWVLGASIGVVWISFALLYSKLGFLEGRVFLVVAIALTVLLGTLSGGFIELSKKESVKTK
jgi:hypothetical protein